MTSEPEDLMVASVREAMDNARENGHTFEGWSHEAVAVDLMDCCSDFETADLAELTRAVEAARG